MSQAPLRVALVSETWAPEVNGVAMTMARLANGLRQRGHQVQVIRPRQGQEAPGDDILVAGMPLPGYKGLQFGLPAGRTLRKLWAAQRPDVVHAVTEGPLGWSALREARALSLPVTSSYHTNFDGYSKHYGAAFVGPLVTAWLRRFHRRTLSTMAPTQSLVKHLSAAKVPGARVLGRGVETALFHPAKRSLVLRQQWGLDDNQLAVINVGRLAAEKNLALATRAFSQIQQQHPDARMIWVGDGPSRPALARQFPKHVFAGTQHGEELAEHYASADIFLFPSLTETYGNVVPEAMASGLAVVSYDTAAAAELIDNEHSGLKVLPGDEQAFINAALRMSTDADLRQRCRQQARLRVEAMSWDKVISDFETILRQAANGQLS